MVAHEATRTLVVPCPHPEPWPGSMGSPRTPKSPRWHKGTSAGRFWGRKRTFGVSPFWNQMNERRFLAKKKIKKK